MLIIPIIVGHVTQNRPKNKHTYKRHNETKHAVSWSIVLYKGEAIQKQTDVWACFADYL